ncbi:putative membrane protein [Sugiyamaella lignohabitans]|uniref:Putative membrane protein n=1 Tax=Sugiyamaella lignohabitans TaxID=796027 RepID=A0A167EUS4_9ASCO|nr:uncharacterized protein AWJ20_2076 [Sugiyamaella lignohabitans]ANB14484.1 putative membrane protein [Sugiyamaella lignohabitans]
MSSSLVPDRTPGSMSQYSKINLVSYLLLCLFVISFLVFLNSTQPFVLTDILGDDVNIGDKVGSLAFADEIVSIVLCPLWGSLSDKVGTRPVSVIGLLILSTSLFFYTTGNSVYPDLLLLRMFFAVGTSACVSMIPAILAELSASYEESKFDGYRQVEDMNWGDDVSNDEENDALEAIEERNAYFDDPTVVSRDTPFFEQSEASPKSYRNAKLAGLVGVVTGIGAVLSVSLFLPLPTWLDRNSGGENDAKIALRNSYYIVSAIAFFVSILLFLGLHKDRSKSFRLWLNGGSVSIFDEAALDTMPDSLPYFQTIKMGFLAAKDRQVALSYVGGLVARSATVALTLFVPLAVNFYFYEQGICKVGDPHDALPDVKKGCHEAYVLAAILTGIANTVSLVFAPIWGLLGDYIGQHGSLMVSALVGFTGCIGFAFVEKPNSPVSFVMACFLGAGQIGAIVLSMSMCTNSRRQYNGSISGVYSLSGGLGILLITKVGGYISDIWKGAPFVILAGFYFLLCIAIIWALPKGESKGFSRLFSPPR